jgi:hypothetical protein
MAGGIREEGRMEGIKGGGEEGRDQGRKGGSEGANKGDEGKACLIA